MNYIPLYRKYRPQKLEEVVGQEHIKNALKSAIDLNKISHAYLFTGPRGTGKTSTARIFAKSLNCVNGPTVNPCGECENCVAITNSTPMDVIEIDAASNRKVEDAQEILEKVMYAPVNSRYKIYIIDEVHMLTSTAFNALLKTLEEPPKNVIFILATTEVHKVLDTIKSRCQRFDFKRITTEDIIKHLRYIAEQEKINITDDALSTIAKNSAGGMRDSIALLDQLSVLGVDKAITTDDINNLLGRISFDILHNLSEHIASSNADKAVELLENIYNSGNEPVLILNDLLNYLKNLLIAKNCRKEIAIELTQMNDIQLETLKEQAKKLESQQIISLADKCAEYIKELKTTNNPRLWLEIAIIDLANLTENTKLHELEERICRLEGRNYESAKFSAYKTMPQPIPKPEILKTAVKNTIDTKDTKPTEKINEPKTQNEQNAENNTVKETADKTSTEEFSPMPKAKIQNGVSISDLWKQLLENITSPPTKALLKQWALPVKISSDETVIAMKSEIFLKQVQSGNKYNSIVSAIDSMFEQKNSNVIVRLASADDKNVEQPEVTQVKKVTSAPVVEKEIVPDIEEIQDAKQDIEKQNNKPAKSKDIDAMASAIHSDEVNMVVNLFDGKIIE